MRVVELDGVLVHEVRLLPLEIDFFRNIFDKYFDRIGATTHLQGKYFLILDGLPFFASFEELFVLQNIGHFKILNELKDRNLFIGFESVLKLNSL